MSGIGGRMGGSTVPFRSGRARRRPARIAGRGASTPEAESLAASRGAAESAIGNAALSVKADWSRVKTICNGPVLLIQETPSRHTIAR
jgi:hypothetical protein